MCFGILPFSVIRFSLFRVVVVVVALFYLKTCLHIAIIHCLLSISVVESRHCFSTFKRHAKWPQQNRRIATNKYSKHSQSVDFCLTFIYVVHCCCCFSSFDSCFLLLSSLEMSLWAWITNKTHNLYRHPYGLNKYY